MATIRGSRQAGHFVGFDYQSQNWYDTNPQTPRDETKPPGSAGNPIACLDSADTIILD
jgi:hypothetical protein